MALHLHHLSKWHSVMCGWLTLKLLHIHPSVVCAETDNEAVVNNTSLQYASVAQLDRAPRYERGGYGFETYRLHFLIWRCDVKSIDGPINHSAPD